MFNTSKIIAQDNYRLLIILAAGSLTPMAGGVLAPVLPDLIAYLQIDPVLAGSLVSMHSLTIAIFAPFWGILADKIGPNKVLVPGLISYGLFGILGALMGTFWPLLLTRALLGVSAGAIAASSLGLLAQMYDGEARQTAIGYATATLTITGMIYPLLGGIIGSNHWQYAFYLYGLAIPLGMMGQSLFSGEKTTKKKSPSLNLGGQFSQLFNNSLIWLVLLTIALASLVMYAAIIYTPLYLKNTFSTPAELNGLVLALKAVGATIISAFGAKLIAKFVSQRGAIALGFGMMGLMLIIVPNIPIFQLVFFTSICFGMGFGLAMPNLYSILANIAPEKLQSTVLAAGTGFGFLGQFFAPLVVGPILALSGLESVFYGTAIIAMLSGLILLIKR
jgi:MFS transporter, ACDE family, multidrug resistance protein